MPLSNFMISSHKTYNLTNSYASFLRGIQYKKGEGKMAWEKSEMIGVMDKLFIITPHSNHSKYLEQFWVSFNLPKMLCFHGGHIHI